MPTANVNLSPRQVKIIEGAIKGGHYQNVSEVVRAGLELLMQKEKEDRLRLRLLRKMIKEDFDDLDAGQYTTVEYGDIDGYLEALCREARRAHEKQKSQRARLKRK